MKRLRSLRIAALSLACVGMILPHPETLAAGPKKATIVPAVTDVALTANGTVAGQLLNAEGVVLDGAVVSIRKGGKEVARTVTNKNGVFAVKSLKSGQYQVVAGKTQGTFRFWSAKTAPPAASKIVKLVQGKGAVRAQFGGLDIVTLTTLGAAITGVTLAAVNLSKLNDIEDRVDKIPTSP